MHILTDLVPSTGHTCLVFIPSKGGKGGVTHVWGDLHDQKFVEDTMQRFERRGFNSYFAVSSFTQEGTDGLDKKPSGREIRYVDSTTALWLDIDAGPEKYAKHADKVYRTQDDAFDALYEWLDEFAVPYPTYIVSSGFGVHAYWVLTEVQQPEDWRYAAQALVAVARAGKLKIDSGASTNVAGLMRLPGSYHMTAKSYCEVVSTHDRIHYDTLLDKLLAELPRNWKPETVEAKAPTGVLKNLGIDSRPKFLPSPRFEHWAVTTQFGGRIRDFNVLVSRSVDDRGGRGCEQVRAAIENPSAVEYDVWRGILSLAMNCEDGERHALKVFRRSDKFDEQYTRNKMAELVDRPFRCVKFHELNPDLCDACPFWKKRSITTPLQLAEKTEEAKGEDLVAEVVRIRAGGDDAVRVKEQRPELMWPFFWGRDGSLNMKFDKEGEAEESKQVLPTSLYLSHLVYDPEHGQVGVFTHLPKRFETNQILVPFENLAKNDKLLEIMHGAGVIPDRHMRETLVSFLVKSAQQAQETQDLRETQELFGWTPSMNGFVLGNVEYTTRKPILPVLGARAAPFASSMTPPADSDLAQWKRAVAMYAHSGLEAAQFLLGLSLASPLFELVNATGAVVHCYSTVSGTGKTTAAETALSVWGAPKAHGSVTGIGGTFKDTDNATVNRMGTLNSIPTLVDEITTWSTDMVSNFVYGYTDRREKQRLSSDSTMKASVGRWTAPVFTTGNESLLDKLGGRAASGEGLTNRIVELDFTTAASILDFGYSKRDVATAFDEAAKRHYAVAGHMVAQWLMEGDNDRRAVALWDYWESAAEDEFSFAQAERFWKGAVVAALCGIDLGRTLGLWRFEASDIIDFLKPQLNRMRRGVTSIKTQRTDIVLDFLAEMSGNVLLVQKSGGVMYPARDTVLVRVDRPGGHLAFSAQTLRRWCEKNKANLTDATNWLLRHGARSERYNLTKSVSKYTTQRLVCYVLPLEAIGEDHLAKLEEDTHD